MSVEHRRVAVISDGTRADAICSPEGPRGDRVTSGISGWRARRDRARRRTATLGMVTTRWERLTPIPMTEIRRRAHRCARCCPETMARALVRRPTAEAMPVGRSSAGTLTSDRRWCPRAPTDAAAEAWHSGAAGAAVRPPKRPAPGPEGPGAVGPARDQLRFRPLLPRRAHRPPRRLRGLDVRDID